MDGRVSIERFSEIDKAKNFVEENQLKSRSFGINIQMVKLLKIMTKNQIIIFQLKMI